jgi:plastocyanin
MKRRQFVTSVLTAGAAVPVLAAGQHDHGDDVSGPLANATVSFGQWKTDPALDRFATPNPITGNVHKLIPSDTKIKAGGTINFIISGFHLVTVYGPGTEFDDLFRDGNFPTAPLPGAPPGFPPVVDISTDRIYRGSNPLTLPQDRIENVNFPSPGRFLVVCTFVPHFVDRMFGHVTVLP